MHLKYGMVKGAVLKLIFGKLLDASKLFFEINLVLLGHWVCHFIKSVHGIYLSLQIIQLEGIIF